MKMTALAAALVVSTGNALAADGPGFKCPDGKPPRFNGRPFDPLQCAKPGQPAEKPSPVAEESLPAASTGDAQTLAAAVGRWQGIAVYGADRYEVLLFVGKSGKGYKIRFEQKEYRLLTRRSFDVELKGARWGSKGRYDAAVALAELPNDPREAVVNAGAPLPPDAAGLDHELVLVYHGGGDVHRLRYRVEKDVLSYRYDYEFSLPKRGKITTRGELRRTEKLSL